MLSHVLLLPLVSAADQCVSYARSDLEVAQKHWDEIQDHDLRFQVDEAVGHVVRELAQSKGSQ